MIIKMMMALLSTIMFALIFRVPPRALLTAGLVGVGAWTVEAIGTSEGMSPIASSFFAALFVAVAAEGLARIQRLPSTVYTVAGIVPLVPGLSAFRTMRAFVAGDTISGIYNGVTTSLIAGAIAAGLVLAGALARMNRRPEYARQRPTDD